MRLLQLYHALVVLTSLPNILALKTGDWKTCEQSAFCRRGRNLAKRAAEATSGTWTSPYSIDPSSLLISPSDASFSASVKSSIYPDVKFKLDVEVLHDGVVRLRMDEVNGLKKRYDEAASWALITEPVVSKKIKWSTSKGSIQAAYDDVTLTIQYHPLRVSLSRGGKEEIVLNGNGLLHMEHFRAKTEKIEAPNPEEGSDEPGEVVLQQPDTPNFAQWFEGEEDGWWEEKFLSWTDSKPKGPESLSLDIDYPNHGHVYGIPQHATSLDLPTTKGENPFFTEPYRLYNADVFEYLHSSPMSLYGSIPLMYAHSSKSTVGIFNAVGSETWIDVAHPESSSTHTHWISESGILDIFLLPGPTPAEIFSQYARLTGTPSLPPNWALGYHQCRWNYISSDDVRGVQQRFDEDDIPVDVFWLDIEYAEDHKYFIWDKKNFPDPVEMTQDVAALGRKMVVIVDPHLKRASDYPVYQQASDLGVLVKPSSGQGEYEGWCWPGSSSWVDYFHPGSWKWWQSLFKLSGDSWSWKDSAENVYIWNDMNEPSVFNGPEITMPKDNIHFGGWEHRDVHNINGMLFSNATSQAIKYRTDPPRRPFVLTRSFYAGSQRFGAMWTGDNLGTWEHMAVGIPMVLANGIGGMSFAGADVGGFFGNPEPEMLVRWYQVGAFGPFFRAHAHIDTKRREPYLLEEPYKSMVRDILKLRYSLLPVWYTAFRETSVTGIPILRPQFVMFPQDEAGFSIDNQYYIGSSGLLVRPVTVKDAREATVYLSDRQTYYDYFTSYMYLGGNKAMTVKAELDQLPLFIQGGSIIPTRERPRRSSPLMKLDPFTLRIALDMKQTARGELYLDDGESYEHEQGLVVWREFTAGQGSPKGGSNAQTPGFRICSRDLATERPADIADGASLSAYNPRNTFAESLKSVRVEKIIVLGMAAKPNFVKIEADGRSLEWEWERGVSASGSREGGANVLRIKDPRLAVIDDWTIVIT